MIKNIRIPISKDINGNVRINKGAFIISVAKKIMGDVTIAAIEGIGGIRIGEEDTIDTNKNDILSFRIVPSSNNN